MTQVHSLFSLIFRLSVETEEGRGTEFITAASDLVSNSILSILHESHYCTKAKSGAGKVSSMVYCGIPVVLWSGLTCVYDWNNSITFFFFFSQFLAFYKTSQQMHLILSLILSKDYR